MCAGRRAPPVPLRSLAPFQRPDLLGRRVAGANDLGRRRHRLRRVPRGLAKPTLDKRLATLAPTIAHVMKVCRCQVARRAAKALRCKRSLYAESVTYRPKTATLERFCIAPPSLIASSSKTGTASRYTAGNACGAPLAQVQGGDSEAKWNGVHGRKADRTGGSACFSRQPAARLPNPMCGRFFIRAGGRPSAVYSISRRSRFSCSPASSRRETEQTFFDHRLFAKVLRIISIVSGPQGPLTQFWPAIPESGGTNAQSLRPPHRHPPAGHSLHHRRR